MGKNQQSVLFKGIFEFEDPSGVLLAAKIPANGSADLYSGTAIVVKANQCALFVYKGKDYRCSDGGDPPSQDGKFPNSHAFGQLAVWF